MAKTRDIKRRIKAVGNIRRITKTMQMIATARFQAAMRRATASKPYSQKLAELVGQLARAGDGAAGGALDHPLLRSPSPAVGRVLLLVLTSNRGLCGGYNANILRVANKFLQERKVEGQVVEVEVEVVGKKGVNFFRYANQKVSKNHTQFSDKPEYPAVEALANEYIARFTEGKFDAVYVASMNFESVGRQTALAAKLLPMEPPKDKAPKPGAAKAAATVATAATQFDFSPAPEELLAELLPETVKIRLFQAFNDAQVSEQVARMVAMKAATDAAGKMGKFLSRKYNRARQAAITTELTEIISGTAALE